MRLSLGLLSKLDRLGVLILIVDAVSSGIDLTRHHALSIFSVCFVLAVLICDVGIATRNSSIRWIRLALGAVLIMVQIVFLAFTRIRTLDHLKLAYLWIGWEAIVMGFIVWRSMQERRAQPLAADNRT